jgi:hypothetical protein
LNQVRIAVTDSSEAEPSKPDFKRKGTIVFNQANWNTSQHQIMVKAVEDYLEEVQPFHWGAVLHSVSSLDLSYDVIEDLELRAQIFEKDLKVPPSLVNARQSDVTNDIWVTFDISSFTKSPSGEWKQNSNGIFRCQTVFSMPESLDALKCKWNKDCTKIRIMLQEPNQWLMDNKLGLKSDVLKPSATAELSSAGSIAVKPRPKAPMLSNAYFGSTGATIRAQFDAGTNQAGQTNAGGPCSDVFVNTNLGAGAVCRWPSIAGQQPGQVVVITFGNGATLGVLSLLQLAAESVRGIPYREPEEILAGESFVSLVVASGSICVSRPIDSTVIPHAVLSQPPAEISSCDNLQLDASTSQGNAGRTMKFTWSVTTASPQLPLLEDFLAQVSEGIDSDRSFCSEGAATANAGYSIPGLIIVPSCLMVPGYLHSFSVTVSNFLSDITDTASVEVSVASLPVPKVWFPTGSILTTSASEAVSISVSGQSSGCGDLDSIGSKIAYQWSGKSATLIMSDHVCSSAEVDLGVFENFGGCLEACKLTNGCLFFVFGKGTQFGKCYHELTQTRGCSEGWLSAEYDFYQANKNIITKNIVDSNKIRIQGAARTILKIGSFGLLPGSINIIQVRATMIKQPSVSNEAAMEITVSQMPLQASLCIQNDCQDTSEEIIVGRSSILILNGKSSFDPNYPIDHQNRGVLVRWKCSMHQGNLYKCPLPFKEGSYVEQASVEFKQKEFPADYYKIEMQIKSKSTEEDQVWSAPMVRALQIQKGCPPAVSIDEVDRSDTKSTSIFYRLSYEGCANPPEPEKVVLQHQWSQLEGDIQAFNPTENAANPIFWRNVDSAQNALFIMNTELSPGSTYVFRLHAKDGEYDINKKISFTVNSPPTSGTCMSNPATGFADETEFLLRCDGWTDEPGQLPLDYKFSVMQNGSIQRIYDYAPSRNSVQILFGLPEGVFDVVANIADNMGAVATPESFQLIVNTRSRRLLSATEYVYSQSAAALQKQNDGQVDATDILGFMLSLGTKLKSNNIQKRRLSSTSSSAASERSVVRQILMKSIIAASSGIDMSPALIGLSCASARQILNNANEDPDINPMLILNSTRFLQYIISNSNDLLSEGVPMKAMTDCLHALGESWHATNASAGFAESFYLSLSGLATSMGKKMLLGQEAILTSEDKSINLFSSRTTQSGIGDFVVNVPSQSSVNIRAQLPSASVLNDATSSASRFIDIQAASLPNAYDENTTNSSSASEIFRLSLVDESTNAHLEVNHLEIPIVINMSTSEIINYSSSSDASNILMTCAYWNNTYQDWTSDGLDSTHIVGTGEVQCATTHLTDFTIIRSFRPPSESIDKDSGPDPFDQYEDPDPDPSESEGPTLHIRMSVYAMPELSMKSFATAIAVLMPSLFLYVVVFGFFNYIHASKSHRQQRSETRKAELLNFNNEWVTKSKHVDPDIPDICGELKDTFSGRTLRSAQEMKTIDIKALHEERKRFEADIQLRRCLFVKKRNEFVLPPPPPPPPMPQLEKIRMEKIQEKKERIDMANRRNKLSKILNKQSRAVKSVVPESKLAKRILEIKRKKAVLVPQLITETASARFAALRKGTMGRKTLNLHKAAKYAIPDAPASRPQTLAPRRKDKDTPSFTRIRKSMTERPAIRNNLQNMASISGPTIRSSAFLAARLKKLSANNHSSSKKALLSATLNRSRKLPSSPAPDFTTASDTGTSKNEEENVGQATESITETRIEKCNDNSGVIEANPSHSKLSQAKSKFEKKMAIGLPGAVLSADDDYDDDKHLE